MSSEPETRDVKTQGAPRFRRVPLRLIVPNLVTLLALCSGLTAVRMAFDGRWELAVGAVLLAAVLDGLDGRVARMLKGTSRFGAELDSLSDFVNFGVVPALMLYLWLLKDAGNLGWITALIFAISMALRLARFNVALDDPNKPGLGITLFYRHSRTGRSADRLVAALSGVSWALSALVCRFNDRGRLYDWDCLPGHKPPADLFRKNDGYACPA